MVLPPRFAARVFPRKSIALFDGDSQQPGLKRTLSLKRTQIAHHGEKCLLANLFRVFMTEIAGKLEDETRDTRIIFIEQNVPRLFIAGALIRIARIKFGSQRMFYGWE